MNNEKVTTTEETNVSTSSERNGTPDVEVSSEKTVEHTEKTSDDAAPDKSGATDSSTVNVKVENNMPATAPQSTAPNPNKNYEAAQPVVDPV